MPDKYTIEEFATKIRNKYNAYHDMDDTELIDRIIAKYPVYKDQIEGMETSVTIDDSIISAPEEVEDEITVEEVDKDEKVIGEEDRAESESIEAKKIGAKIGLQGALSAVGLTVDKEKQAQINLEEDYNKLDDLQKEVVDKIETYLPSLEETQQLKNQLQEEVDQIDIYKIANIQGKLKQLDLGGLTSALSTFNTQGVQEQMTGEYDFDKLLKNTMERMRFEKKLKPHEIYNFFSDPTNKEEVTRRMKNTFVQDGVNKSITKEVDEILHEYEDKKLEFKPEDFAYTKVLDVAQAIGIAPVTYDVPESLKKIEDAWGKDSGLATLFRKKWSYAEGRGQLEDYYKKLFKHKENVEIALVSDNQLQEAGLLDIYSSKIQELEKKFSDPLFSQPSQEDIDEYNNLINKYTTHLDSYEAYSDRLENLTVQANVIGQVSDMTRRSYNTDDVLNARVKTGLYNMWEGVVGFSNEFKPVMDWMGVDPFDIAMNFNGVDINDEEQLNDLPEEQANAYRELKRKYDNGDLHAEYVKGLRDTKNEMNSMVRLKQEFGKIDNLSTFGSWALDTFGEQGAQIALTIAVPGAAIPVMGMVGAGNKFNDMTLEMRDGIYNPVTGETTYPKYSTYQYYTSGILYGAAEALTEMPLVRQFKSIIKPTKQFRFIKNNFKKAKKLDEGVKGLKGKKYDLKGTDFSREAFTIKDAAKKWGMETFVRGGGSEAVATILQNGVDRFVLDENVALTEGVVESFFTGALISGLGFSAPVLASDFYRAVSGSKTWKKVQKNRQQIEDYSNRLQQLQFMDPKDPNVQQAKRNYNKAMRNLIDEQLTMKGESENLINRLNNYDKRVLLDADADIFRLQGEIDQINNNPLMGDAYKKAEIDAKANEITRLEAVKEQKIAHALGREGDVKGQTEALERSIARATEMAAKVFGKDVNVKAVENEAELAALMKEKGFDEKTFKQSKLAKSRGFIMPDGTIVINKAVAVKEGAGSTVEHELLHAVLKKTIGEGREIGNRLGGALLTHLQKIDPTKVRDTGTFKKRLLSYLNDPSMGEEVITLFSEAVSDGHIKFNETTFTKLGDRLRNILRNMGVNVRFRTGRDVYNFIKDYNKNIQEGEFSKGLTKMIQKGAKGRLVKPTKKAPTKPDIKEARGEINLETKENQDRLDELPGPKGKDGKYEMSKKDWLNSDAFAAAKALIDGTAFDKLIGAKIASGKDIYGRSREEILEDTKDELIKHLERFNPQESGSLFGYINSFIGRKVGTVTGRAKKKGRTISHEQRQEATGKELISEEISPEEYADIQLVKDKLKKIKPQISKVAKKLDLTRAEENLIKRDIINYLRNPKRPPMSDTKKFFKGFVDHMGTTAGTRLYNKMPNKKGMEAFVKKFADDLIALNKVDPAVMRRSNWKIFYKTEIEKMNPTQTQQAIDEGRIPVTTSLTAGNTLWEVLDPSPEQVVDYLLNIRQDVLKRKLPKFFAEVLGKNEFNEILDNLIQPVYTAEGKVKKDSKGKEITVDIAESLTPEDIEVTKAPAKIKEKIARPEGIKFSQSEVTKAEETVKESIKEEVIGYINLKEDIKNWNKLIKDLKGTPYNFNDRDPKSKIGAEAWIKDALPKLVKILPKSFFYNSFGTFAGYGSVKRGYRFPFVDASGKGKHADVFKKYMDENFGGENQVQYGPENSTIAKALVRVGVHTKKFDEEFGTEAFNENNKLKTKALKEIFKIFSTAIKTNKATVADIAGLLVSTSAHQPHFMRVLAPTTFRQINLTSKTPQIEEHALGASLVAKQGLFLAAADLIKDNFIGIQLNYFQGPISRVSDDKVNRKEYGMKEGPAVEDVYDVLMGVTGGWVRYASVPDFDLNTIEIINNEGNKQILTEHFNVNVDVPITPVIIAKQNELIVEIERGNITKEIARKEMDAYLPLVKSINNARKRNIKASDNSGVIKESKSLPNDEILKELDILDKALNIARNPNAPVKKIRVFDFDDTLARTKSNVLYTMPDGTTGKLTAEEFAKRGDEMLAEGAKWDFSEFEKVMKGKKGPLFKVAEMIADKRGTKDIFVLTARPPSAAPAIQEFLKSLGLDIPIQNITGLANSSPLAKSGWIVEKAAEGYNDFYFADDHTGNVNAVKKVLDVIDVKSKVQQAKIKFSKSIDEIFNTIIEQKKGVDTYKEFSKAKAHIRGKGKGRLKFFIPYSAEDFVGLLYPLVTKGKTGDAQLEWFNKHLMEPYGRAMENLSRDQNQLRQDFIALKKELVKSKKIPKNLRKEAIEGWSYEQVARVYAWNQQGIEIDGISKKDLKDIVEFVENDPALKLFSEELININKGDGYSYPGHTWLVGTITTDLIDGLRTNKRAKYLEQWQQNVDLIFSEKNLNKLEATFGSKYREAMEDMLRRMKSGKNRKSTSSRLENRLLDYLNNSVGAVMFLNMRSAVLQTISAINFLNWTDNNPIKAGAAFANQPQYWKDFMTLMNSDFLVDRRNGLRINVSESEIADAAASSPNKAKGVINFLLKKGFITTQIADSFAIASGGATFYRNRLNKYKKARDPDTRDLLYTEKEAQEKAFQDFREKAEESQQSARPDRISQQQASGLGRVILAFANTPMQYTRIMKKAAIDLKNNRGDWKSNVSKILYYGAIQNIMFTAIQQALFALMFDDEEDEEKKKEYYRVANSMTDNILRGLGIGGTAIAALKNTLLDLYDRSKRSRPEYHKSAFKLLDFSPPLDIKISKFRQAMDHWEYNRWKPEANDPFNIDNPAYMSSALILSSLTNVPLDRLLKKVNNVRSAMEYDEETWKRIAYMLGWPEWQLESSKEKETRKQEEKKAKARIRKENKKKGVDLYNQPLKEKKKKKKRKFAKML